MRVSHAECVRLGRSGKLRSGSYSTGPLFYFELAHLAFGAFPLTGIFEIF